MSIRTIIVEDEPLSRAFLNNLLAEFCPDVEVLATLPTEAEAVAAIETLRPGLVFMDIELQQGTGFEVLKKTRHCNYQVIFTTAFDHYSIRALKFSGVHYLQKPIDFEGLQEVMASVTGKQQNSSENIAVLHLLQTLENNHVPQHLLLQTGTGSAYIPVAGIMYIELSENGCVFYTTEGRIASNCKAIKDFEQMLLDHHFLRVHQAYIINCKQVNRASEPDTGFVMMNDKTMIPISAKKVEEIKGILTTIF